jgi:hypothetical protein
VPLIWLLQVAEGPSINVGNHTMITDVIVDLCVGGCKEHGREFGAEPVLSKLRPFPPRSRLSTHEGVVGREVDSL